MLHMSQQDLFLVPVLKMFGAKLVVQLLCTIINVSPNNVILADKWHIWWNETAQ